MGNEVRPATSRTLSRADPCWIRHELADKRRARAAGKATTNSISRN